MIMYQHFLFFLLESYYNEIYYGILESIKL